MERKQIGLVLCIIAVGILQPVLACDPDEILACMKDLDNPTLEQEIDLNFVCTTYRTVSTCFNAAVATCPSLPEIDESKDKIGAFIDFCDNKYAAAGCAFPSVTECHKPVEDLTPVQKNNPDELCKARKSLIACIPTKTGTCPSDFMEVFDIGFKDIKEKVNKECSASGMTASKVLMLLAVTIMASLRHFL